MEKLADSDTGFVYLARKLDPTQRREDRASSSIEGIGTVVEPRRTYPQGSLASQLLGSVGTDNYGLSGLEQSLEDDAARHGRQAPARQGRPGRAGQHRRDRARRAPARTCT